jgi:hypothetical protein
MARVSLRVSSAVLTALLAWAGAPGLQVAWTQTAAPAQQAQAAGRAIVGEWSFLCNAPQRLAFAEDPSGKLKRFYLREGIYRADEETVTVYSEDANFIRLKFGSGEEIVYKRSPEGIREWERRIPGRDPITKDGKTQFPVVRTFVDTPIFQRCK